MFSFACCAFASADFLSSALFCGPDGLLLLPAGRSLPAGLGSACAVLVSPAGASFAGADSFAGAEELDGAGAVMLTGPATGAGGAITLVTLVTLVALVVLGADNACCTGDCTGAVAAIGDTNVVVELAVVVLDVVSVLAVLDVVDVLLDALDIADAYPGHIELLVGFVAQVASVVEYAGQYVRINGFELHSLDAVW